MNLVCTNWFEVDCQQSVQIFISEFGHKTQPEDSGHVDDSADYDYNFNDDEYYYFYEEENPLGQTNDNNGQNRFLANSSPALNPSGNQGVGGEQQHQTGFQANNFNGNNVFDYDYGDDYDVGRPPLPPTSTTAIPIGVTTTTTRRPPRVKSNILQNTRNRPGRPNNQQHRPPTTKPKFAQPKVRPDGRPPRVKSNLRGNKNKNNGLNERPRNKQGNRVQISKENIEFVAPEQPEQPVNNFGGNDIFRGPGPEVRPDGRAPRVKSNILASKKNRGNQFNRNNRRPVSTERPVVFNIFPTATTTEAPLPPLRPVTTFTPRISSTPTINLINRFNQQQQATRRPLPQSNRFNQRPPPLREEPKFNNFNQFDNNVNTFDQRPDPPPQEPELNIVNRFNPPQQQEEVVSVIPPFEQENYDDYESSQPFFDEPSFEIEDNDDDLSINPVTPRTFPSFTTRGPGARPKVKSDIRARQQNKGNRNNFNNNRFTNRPRRPVNRPVTRRPITRPSPTRRPFFDDEPINLPPPEFSEEVRFNDEQPQFVDEIDEIENPPVQQQT